MEYVCVNGACHSRRPQPSGVPFCVACYHLLDSYPPENPSSYQPSLLASRDSPRNGTLGSSISIISASSGSGAGTGPSSLYEQVRPSYPPSEYGSFETPQSSSPKSSPKSHGLLERGPDSANFRNRGAARLRNIPPAVNSNHNSSASSLEQAGSSATRIFKLENPSATKSSRASTKACIPCYRRGQKCIISGGQEKCDFCSKESLYCKAPTEMAAGFTPEHCMSKLIERIEAEHIVIDAIIENNPRFDVCITLTAVNQTSSPFAQTKKQQMEKIQVDLRNLRVNTHHGMDREGWERVFDGVHSRLEYPEGEARDPNTNIVRSFRRLCQQFTAALALLGSPELCICDVIAQNDVAGPFIMLETFRQIYVLASSTLSKIFDELNKYKKCSDDAPRHRSIFDRETLRLGFGLGMCHHALSQFGKAPPSDLGGLYDIPSSLIDQLKSLGGTFHPKGFRDGSQAVSSERFELHIGLDAVEGYANQGTKRVTFIQGFERLLSSSLSSPTRHTPSVFSGNPPTVRNFPTSQDLIIETFSEQTSKGDGESRMGAGQPSTNDAELQLNVGQPQDLLEPETMKQNYRLEVAQLQQERDGLDELEKQTKERKARVDNRLASIQLLLNVWPRRDPDGKYDELGGSEEQMLPFTTPILTDADDNTLLGLEKNPSLEESLEFYSSREDDGLGSAYRADREDWPMTDLDMPLSTSGSLDQAKKHQVNNDQRPPPIKKRKRQTPQQAIGRFNDDVDAITPDSMDVEPAASTEQQVSTSVSFVRKQLLQTVPTSLSFLTRKSRPDPKTDGHADFAPGTPSADIKSQRPQSWPRTQQRRKSSGVSVKALRETFEKLALESTKATTAPGSIKQTSLPR